MAENRVQTETLTHDVNAFCALLARIMYRCLSEKDPRFMVLLSMPVTEVTGSSTLQRSEVKHDQAA